MEKTNEEKAIEKLQSFLGEDVFISINGIISMQIIYENFKFFMNKKHILMCDKFANELDVQMGSIEIIKSNDCKVILQLDNDQEITLEL